MRPFRSRTPALGDGGGFAVRNLSVLSYAQGYTEWHYRGNQTALGAVFTKPVTIAEVCARSFFDMMSTQLNAGDTIMCSCADGGVLLYVDSVTGTVNVRVMAQTK